MKRLAVYGLAVFLLSASFADAGEPERITLSVASVAVKPSYADEPALFITLDTDSQKALAAFSERHVGSQISIMAAGREVSRPRLVSPLNSAETVLTCNRQDCDALAKAIDAAKSITISTVP